MTPSPDDAIDENYGVNVVFHEEEEEDPTISGHVEGGGGDRKTEGMIAQDDEDIVDDDEDEGMEADYDEVLKTAVSDLCTLVVDCSIARCHDQPCPLFGV